MASKDKLKEIKKSSQALYAELDFLLGNKKKKEKVFEIIASIIKLDLKKTKLKNKLKFNELLKELTPEFEKSAIAPTPLKITASKSTPAKATRKTRTPKSESAETTSAETTEKPSIAPKKTRAKSTRAKSTTTQPKTGSLALGAVAAASALVKLGSVAQIKEFIKGDKRVTVLNRAKAKIKSLESNS